MTFAVFLDGKFSSVRCLVLRSESARREGGGTEGGAKHEHSIVQLSTNHQRATFEICIALVLGCICVVLCDVRNVQRVKADVTYDHKRCSLLGSVGHHCGT